MRGEKYVGKKEKEYKNATKATKIKTSTKSPTTQYSIICSNYSMALQLTT